MGFNSGFKGLNNTHLLILLGDAVDEDEANVGFSTIDDIKSFILDWNLIAFRLYDSTSSET